MVKRENQRNASVLGCEQSKDHYVANPFTSTSVKVQVHGSSNSYIALSSLRQNSVHITMTHANRDSILSKLHVVSFWWFRVESRRQKKKNLSFSEFLSTAEETCHLSATCSFGISRRTELTHTDYFWHDGGTMALGLLESTNCSRERQLVRVASWYSLGCGPLWIRALPSKMPLRPIGRFRFTIPAVASVCIFFETVVTQLIIQGVRLISWGRNLLESEVDHSPPTCA